ncbi:MarR family transcriptional regulator [Siculibacillus lacustris]|uniref:MarR family transcriptional regulator n=1 Tax=Siculibacillus lacustris TaxID=1549641 RepID=A0A4Q9VWR3_9HYPH|nr:MarR family transcriptional regulator [Siculibacillus lacustris]TBW40780.1 MarR family transcriptional regulator [Siculibacillus lacustris]
MTFQHRKSVTHRLAMAAKAHRARSGTHLARIGLHAGQEAVLKALADEDGRTMSQLAQALGVQPPTVTKMVSRLSAQGLLQRVASQTDGRLARVHLTELGRGRIDEIDRIWKRIEREALAGFDDKDRKKLRKFLRAVERNLTLQLDSLDDVAIADEPEDDPEE